MRCWTIVCVCVCVCCCKSDNIFCRGMNILWSELIRRSASWEHGAEFVLFQIICVMNYTSQGFNNMKTTRLQSDGGYIYPPHIKKVPGPLYCPACTPYFLSVKDTLNLLLNVKNHYSKK